MLREHRPPTDMLVAEPDGSHRPASNLFPDTAGRRLPQSNWFAGDFAW